MTYINPAQYDKLIAPINPARTNRNKKGYSHVEAYELRAQLTRIFGFGRWSAETLCMEPIFETLHSVQREGKPTDVVTCAYRAQVRLTVFAPDGTTLASYTEWASGDAQNFNVNSRGDAHDFAIKTAESQAFKRAAANLGDQFGLSLYKKGSTQALVYQSLVKPEGAEERKQDDDKQQDVDVDAHVDATPPEDEPTDSEGEPDPRATSQAPAKEPVTERDANRAKHKAEELRSRAFAALAPEVPKGAAMKELGRIVADVTKERLRNFEVADEQGEATTLGALVESFVKLRNNGVTAGAS